MAYFFLWYENPRDHLGQTFFKSRSSHKTFEAVSLLIFTTSAIISTVSQQSSRTILLILSIFSLVFEVPRRAFIFHVLISFTESFVSLTHMLKTYSIYPYALIFENISSYKGVLFNFIKNYNLTYCSTFKVNIILAHNCTKQ